MMVEFPIYLVNHAKTRKSERLPKNCLATDVASALTAASIMFCFFSPLNTTFQRATTFQDYPLVMFNITAKHYTCCTTVITACGIIWNDEQLCRNNGRKHWEQKNRIISTFISIIDSSLPPGLCCTP